MVGYAVSFYALSHVFADLPLGLAYAIWTSAAVALTAVVSRIIWKEKFNAKKDRGHRAHHFRCSMPALGGDVNEGNPILILSVAIGSEVLGTTSMKLSEGFTQPVFGIVTAACYILSFVMLTFALKDLSLGMAYGIWGGVGTFLTTLIGIIFWNDRSPSSSASDDRGRCRHRAAQQGDARSRGSGARLRARLEGRLVLGACKG